MRELNVVLLTNFIPPYRLPLFRDIGAQFGSFRVLQSITMSPERPWTAEHSGLQVETQRTITLRAHWSHPYGFRDRLSIHIPYDTLGRLHRLKPDVVISAEIGFRTAQAAAHRLLHPRSRLIIWAAISEHTEEGRDFSRRVLRRILMPSADAVIVNGASGANYVRRFGVASEKIFIAPYTTDGCLFSALSLTRSAAERRRLLYVGQLVKRKGLFALLSALSRWCKAHSNAEVELWLVGDGPERAYLERTELPPNLVLRFCGNVGFENLPNFYKQAGILAFPTLSDEWGVVVNEAMAAGMPVLGSIYSQAVEELVKDGVTGWTFRPNQSDEMYIALERALTTPSEALEQMGVAARKAVEHLTPRFGTNRIMDAIRFVSGKGRGEDTAMVCETIKR